LNQVAESCAANFLLKYKKRDTPSMRGKKPKIIKNRGKEIIFRCMKNGLKMFFSESGIIENKAGLF